MFNRCFFAKNGIVVIWNSVMHRLVSPARVLSVSGGLSRTLVTVTSGGQHGETTNAASSTERRLNAMRAWRLDTGVTEESDQLRCHDNVPLPTLRNATDVLVEVHAASINPLDLAMMKGYGTRLFDTIRCVESTFTDRPKSQSQTLGRDFSGVVRNVITSTTEPQFQQGDEVVGVIGPHVQLGSHAEHVLASSDMLVKKPKGLSHVEAASLAYAGLTAWSSLRCFGGIRKKNIKGKRALILGGSGGVGTIAIQILKAYGFQVITVVNGDAIPLVLGLGADQALDYSQPEWENSLRKSEKYDIILNCTKNLSSTFGMNLLKPWSNSKYVHTTPPLLRNIDAHGWPRGLLHSAAEFGFDAFKGVRNGQFYSWGYVLPIKSGLEEILHLADAGKIKPVVETVFPFDRMPQAFEKVRSGHARGKTVIDFKSN